MRFFISFGVQYAQEAHPAFVSGMVPAMRACHPDNWIEVEAPTEHEARLLVNRAITNAWSMMYDEAEWEAMSEADKQRWFPGRCILVLSADGPNGVRVVEVAP